MTERIGELSKTLAPEFENVAALRPSHRIGVAPIFGVGVEAAEAIAEFVDNSLDHRATNIRIDQAYEGEPKRGSRPR